MSDYQHTDQDLRNSTSRSHDDFLHRIRDLGLRGYVCDRGVTWHRLAESLTAVVSRARCPHGPLSAQPMAGGRRRLRPTQVDKFTHS